MEQELFPKLKRDEGWDFLVYTGGWFTNVQFMTRHFRNQLFKQEKLFFLANWLLPTTRLLDRFQTLTTTLRNVPDGFLVKLRHTGKSNTLKAGIAKLGLSRRGLGEGDWGSFMLRPSQVEELHKHGYAIVKKPSFDRAEHELRESLPIVDGEIEVVEVKLDEGFLGKNQVKSYKSVVSNGYVLRFFHVEFISFKRNEFEIREKTIEDPAKIVLGIALE